MCDGEGDLRRGSGGASGRLDGLVQGRAELLEGSGRGRETGNARGRDAQGFSGRLAALCTRRALCASSTSTTMHSLHPSPARPLGPRTLARSSSPAPFALPEVAPLNIRKVSAVKDEGRPKLKLPKIDFKNLAPDEGPFAGGYAGGPQANNSATPRANGDGPGEPTIKPDQTISPRPRPPPVVSMENIRQIVEEFDQWSDDLLEELSRLGEGAGGAVYKVRDRRTGTIMARKSITTLEAPMKQLLREIRIISSTSHVNIINFYGAYITPLLQRDQGPHGVRRGRLPRVRRQTHARNRRPRWREGRWAACRGGAHLLIFLIDISLLLPP